VALQISSFEDNYPPTCSDLVHPNRGRVAGLTELARLSPIALLVGLGNKVIIEVYCRLSETPIGGTDGRFLWVNLSLRNCERLALFFIHGKIGGGLRVLGR
jgi:hypothetical protein